MAVSKFRLQDWRLGWLVKNGNDTAAVQAVTLTDTAGNPTFDPATGGGLPVVDGEAAVDGAGNITTGTGVVTSTGIDGFSTVTFSIQGTYAGFNAVFEQSDNAGVSWYPVDAYRIGTGLIETAIVNQSSAAINWRATISGSDSFRVRATSLASGTVAVLMSFSGMPSASAVGVTANFADNRPVAGTITIIDSASTTASGLQNGAVLTTGVPTAGSAFALALNGYSGFYALVSGTWTGTLQFEKSIDGGTTWTPFSVHIDGTAYTQVAITANCMVRSAGAGATNIRLRATATVTGTANVQFVFASADTVTTITNSVRLFDNTSGATMAIKPASTAPAATDPAIVVALSPNVTGYLYNNIATDTTTQVKSGAGVLHSVSINSAGTVASTVTISDSTSAGTPLIATINALVTGYFIFDAAFATGLRITTTGTVAPNVTITYR